MRALFTALCTCVLLVGCSSTEPIPLEAKERVWPKATAVRVKAPIEKAQKSTRAITTARENADREVKRAQELAETARKEGMLAGSKESEELSARLAATSTELFRIREEEIRLRTDLDDAIYLIEQLDRELETQYSILVATEAERVTALNKARDILIEKAKEIRIIRDEIEKLEDSLSATSHKLGVLNFALSGASSVLAAFLIWNLTGAFPGSLFFAKYRIALAIGAAVFAPSVVWTYIKFIL